MDEMEVVAMTEPCAFVERSAFGVLVIAKDVVVALVAVTLVNAEVAVVDVAVNEPASALLPRSELPTTESVRHGDVVPRPTLPEKNDVVVLGSNQYSAVVVALEPIATMSDVLFG